MNTLTAAELKRRGMAAIEEALRDGPVHLVKRHKVSAVVLSEEDYARLAQGKAAAVPGMTALQWLRNHPASSNQLKRK
jgi:hypothetical protein